MPLRSDKVHHFAEIIQYPKTRILCLHKIRTFQQACKANISNMQFKADSQTQNLLELNAPVSEERTEVRIASP